MKPKSLVKKLLLFSISFLTVSVLLAHEFAVHSLSSRGLGIGLLILCLATFLVLTLAAFGNRSAAPLLESPAGSPTEAMNRRRRVLGIRTGKTVVVILALLLVNALRQIGSRPLLPLLVGAGVNLYIMAVVIWLVLRLQKSLK